MASATISALPPNHKGNGLLIKIPIKQIDYQDFDRIYPQFLQLKDDYNKMIRGEIPKDNSLPLILPPVIK